MPYIPPTKHELESLATIGKDVCLRQSVSGSAVVNETVRKISMETRSHEVIQKKMPAIEDVNMVHRVP